MDSDRPTISRSGSRPVTRWRREQEPFEKPIIFSDRPLSRSYNKMERPTSRRGIKNDITEYGLSRPPTTTRNVPSRPPSASTLSNNRIPTATPRINLINSANLSRMNTGLPRNFTQANALDRPNTQQRSATVCSVSLQDIPKSSRQIQNKQFYKQSLHLKIQELTREMVSLTRRFAKQSEGKTDSYYNRKTKDFTLKELQDQLIDYNSTLDNMVHDNDRQKFKQCAMQFKALQDQKDEEIRNNYERRKSVENKLNELNKELEYRENENRNRDPELKLKLDIIDSEKNQIQKTFHGLQDEYNQLISEKSNLEEKIALSIKKEPYKLYLKILQAEQKRDQLLQEESNGLIIENENVSEKDIIEVQKKIADAEQELKQLENEIDEDQSENQIKCYQMKREDQFEGGTISLQRAEKLEKLNNLEEKIVELLEKISTSINGHFNSSSKLMPEEMEMIQVLMNENFENYSEKTIEEIDQEIIRLGQIFHTLETLETKIKNQIDGCNENFKPLQDSTLSTNFRDVTIVKEMKIVNNNYSKLIEKIEQDEIHRLINILEDKLSKTTLDNEKLEQLNEEHLVENYSLLLERLLCLISQYNIFLISEIKTVY